MAIDCDAALARMMEAEPAELSGDADTELAAHMNECSRCGAVAARLLEGQAELDRALGEVRPRTSAEEALKRARSRAGRSRGATWRVAVPLAAAAILAGILFLRSTPFQQLPEPTTSEFTRDWERRAFVEARSSRNVLVFETGDRSAKVVWFY